MTQANGKAITTRKTFSRETSISANIRADASILWALLTTAHDAARWNSTIISIEGKIAQGEKIQLKSKLDPKRTFNLAIKAYEPEKRLVWGDAMGSRTYTLEPQSNGITLFTMHEKIGGPLFPLFARMIPSFDASFEQFTADLKREAEAIAQAK